MSDEQPRPRATIIQPGSADLRLKGNKAELWLSAFFARKWYEDSMREAASAGPDARRREILFAACFAESYLLEWVRSDVLQNDFLRLTDYFPRGDRRPLTTKFKKVPMRLHADKLTPAHPDYGRPFWTDFVRLVACRNGLAHACASRPDNEALAKDARPAPTPRDLDAMPQGSPTGVVVALVNELHKSAGTSPPAWLVRPP